MRHPSHHKQADLWKIIAGIPFKLDFYRLMAGYIRYAEAEMSKNGKSRPEIEAELIELITGSVSYFNSTHKEYDSELGYNHTNVIEIKTFLHHAYVFNEEYVLQQTKTF